MRVVQEAGPTEGILIQVTVLPPATWAGRLDNNLATRKRHSPEQVVRKLAIADRMLGKGRTSPTSAASWRSPSRPITAGASVRRAET